MNSKKTLMAAKKKTTPPAASGDFDSLVSSIVHIHRQTQNFAAKAVNVSLTLRNWLIGYRIVEFEQRGKDRAAYGESLMDTLALRLASHGLTRVTPRELRRYRQLYQVYPRIWESLTPKSLAQEGFGTLLSLLPPSPIPIRESVTPESQIVETVTPQLIHRLSFTHLNELIQLPDDTQRRFYEIECIRGNWSVRELRRQIASLYYQRSGLSKDKDKLSAMAHAAAETLQPAHIIRDPYVFEFLGLRSRDVMAESDLEDALLDRLQDFLLELGHGFCFEARQKRILIGDEHFFIDLVFYHRILKCHILVELKTDAFRHEHLGQLNTYVAYYKKHQMTPGGLSSRNLLAMKVFAREFPDGPIAQQPVAQLPWGHVLQIIQRTKDPAAREFYIQETLAHGWSRSILEIQIQNQLHLRLGKAQNNFALTMPPAESDMAAQLFKDPYLFDFLGTADPRREAEVEQALVDHIQKFLLELGTGFAFVGRQVRLEVGDEDYPLDLLFYHLKLRRFVVIELKAGAFTPGDVGQLNLYLSAVDDLLRHSDDQPTIGLLLCRKKNKLVAEYALRGLDQSIAVAAWQTRLTDCLPEDLRSSLPSIEEIEAELANDLPPPETL